MRTLHVFKTYYPETQGGLEEVIRQICIGTSTLGVENRVLTLGPDSALSQIQRDEALVVRYPRSADFASCGVSFSALRHFQTEAQWADIIHYHFPWPFADLLHLAHRINTPALLTYHSDVVRQRALMPFYRPLMRRFLNRIDRIVATSPNYLASSPVLQEYAAKTAVIPIGLHEESYPPVTEAARQRMEHRYGRDFFLFIGVLRYYKGLHILLDALADSEIPVVIAGAGPEEAELRRQASTLGLNRLHFAGRVTDDEKVALYDLCRAVVFPSTMRSEAFGVTLVEGAMYSRPLISAEIGTGTTHVNHHGETGLVVQAGNSASLREAMLLLSDADTAARLGRGARQRYENCFTGRLMATAYLEQYQALRAT